MKHYGISIILIVIFLLSCTKEELILYPEIEADLELKALLYLDDKPCFVDLEKQFIKCSISKEALSNYTPKVTFSDNVEWFLGEQKLKNNARNNWGDIELAKAYPISMISEGKEYHFDLYFTSLPLVNLVHIHDIVDEPKTLAHWIISNPSAPKVWKSYIGVEIRGNSTQTYDKKSFGINGLYERGLSSKQKISALGMNFSTKWAMDAMYIDPSKMRNKVTIELWQNIFSKQNFQADIQFRLVELFINRSYKGIYCISQTVSPEYIGIEGTESVLYKADALKKSNALNSISTNMPTDNFRWESWQQVYPQDKPNWNAFSDFRELLINANDLEFKEHISELIDIDAFIDYYIFMNVTGAWDNTGSNKNLFLLGEEQHQQRLTVIPWDLDYTWDLCWQGTSLGTSSILSNPIYDRLLKTNPNHFKDKLKKRWKDLRNGTLNPSEIMKLFNANFDLLIENNIQYFENSVWNTHQDYLKEKDNIQNWTQLRLNFLDMYFEGIK